MEKVDEKQKKRRKKQINGLLIKPKSRAINQNESIYVHMLVQMCSLCHIQLLLIPNMIGQTD